MNEINISSNSTTFKIHLGDKFDYTLYDKFTDVYQGKTGFKFYEVYFDKVDYIDSSALGTLLLLKEYANERQANVKLKRVKPSVKKILEGVKFNTLFMID
jgi:HptB-dependent secretion and biofilm anti anti-sigma factor